MLAVGAAVLLGLASLAPKLGDAAAGGGTGDVPAGADSTRVAELARGFGAEGVLPAVVVFRRDGGLTAQDRARLAAIRSAIDGAGLEAAAGRTSPPRRSADRKAALMVVPLRDVGNGDPLLDAVKKIRTIAKKHAGGAQVLVTGPAGFQADIANAFGGADVTLLLGAGLIVLVLLVLIYRSPVFWMLPFVTVLLAEGAAEGVGYLLTKSGLHVDQATSGIMSVLVFGAGTDYALLLVARYREELRNVEDVHEAMRRALRTAGPAVLASGLTVCLSLLVLLAATTASTRALGPLSAAGVAIAMLAMLTVLPALVVVVGRRAFWPFVPRVAPHDDPSMRGFWRRLGERAAARPRTTWTTLAVALGVLCLGLLNLETTLPPSAQFTGTVEAIEGQRLLERSFPAGSSASLTVFVPDAGRARAEDVGRRLAAASPDLSGVQSVRMGEAGALVEMTLDSDPFSTRAIAAIPGLRDAARAAGGDGVLVGGETAERYDQRQAARHDDLVVIPLTLLVVLAILIVLLRALVAPLMLTATVVLSFGASLGVGALAFEHLLGFNGTNPTLLLISFVFLIALGIDYNIFLMSRVREETAEHGTREGMLRGLAVTGTVITSAGIVLAGTFSILALLPVVVLVELGFVIAFGVFVDTLLVRSVLVPALVFDVGPRTWWPSALDRGERRVEPLAGLPPS